MAGTSTPRRRPRPLAALARTTGISLRTLQRWHHLYKKEAVAGLELSSRRDRGNRRTDPRIVVFVEHLALTKPRPAIATLHRLAVIEAGRLEVASPSYTTVREIVATLNPAMVTLALAGPASYRDQYELVLRRRADHPNSTWQADHTQLDILIVGVDGKPDRPWLTVIMDDHARAICGYTVFSGA